MRDKLRNFPLFSTVLLIAAIVQLLTSGMSWFGISALVIAAILFSVLFVHWLMKMLESKRAAKSNQTPIEPVNDLVSIVYFLSESREPSEATIRTCVSNAMGVDFDVSDPDSEYFVIQFTPPEAKGTAAEHINHFMVRIPQGLFAVLVSDKPYIDNPAQFAKDAIRDKRLRQAVESHEAWLSVDLMDDQSDIERVAAAYGTIGKIIASLAGPDCLAVYCPELQRCNEFDPALIESLASSDPLRLFDEPTFEPVIEISDDDPRMAAAVEEAIKRWPEFVSAFKRRDPDDVDRYIIKAEFSEGSKSEFMWVSVSEINSEVIRGTLMNDPHELLDVHRGANVTIPMDRLNDWIYPGRDGSHIGGFTLDVLAGDD
ncbi:MAG: hypothetical protein CMO55_03165 [Verrucomicrobiales bacterium]|nr:hypothetical protein [Verrucomicrobiales bacterium]